MSENYYYLFIYFADSLLHCGLLRFATALVIEQIISLPEGISQDF